MATKKDEKLLLIAPDDMYDKLSSASALLSLAFAVESTGLSDGLHRNSGW